jgi:hypothetical protein
MAAILCIAMFVYLTAYYLKAIRIHGDADLTRHTVSSELFRKAPAKLPISMMHNLG